jgi:hypothetical protein
MRKEYIYLKKLEYDLKAKIDFVNLDLKYLKK